MHLKYACENEAEEVNTGESERFGVHSHRYAERELGSKLRHIIKGGYFNSCAN